MGCFSDGDWGVAPRHPPRQLFHRRTSATVPSPVAPRQRRWAAPRLGGGFVSGSTHTRGGLGECPRVGQSPGTSSAQGSAFLHQPSHFVGVSHFASGAASSSQRPQKGECGLKQEFAGALHEVEVDVGLIVRKRSQNFGLSGLETCSSSEISPFSFRAVMLTIPACILDAKSRS